MSCVITGLICASGNCQAEPTTFSDPVIFEGSETLITFDDSGHKVFDKFTQIGTVRFRLVHQETLNDFGQGPNVASAPHTTYHREFPPSDGKQFIQVPFKSDLEIHFGELINTVSAEIRARPVTFSPESLTFELYEGERLISTTTIPDRTGGKYGDFFSYGIQSEVAFDRLVIRNREDERFSLDNLRFAKLNLVTEPPDIVSEATVNKDCPVTCHCHDKLCPAGNSRSPRLKRSFRRRCWVRNRRSR